jgi:hypothetical protein
MGIQLKLSAALFYTAAALAVQVMQGLDGQQLLPIQALPQATLQLQS